MGKCTKDMTTGDCVLGEHYARYVLGLDVNKRDDATKQQVMEAREYYAKNLGIIVATNDDLNALRESPEAYLTKLKSWSTNADIIPMQNIINAHNLMKSLGYDMPKGSWKPRIDGFVSKNSVQPAATDPEQTLNDMQGGSTVGQTPGTTTPGPAGTTEPGAIDPASIAAPGFLKKYKLPLIIGGGLLGVIVIIAIVRK